MIGYIIQSPENITSYEIQTIINRKRVNAGINKFVDLRLPNR